MHPRFFKADTTSKYLSTSISWYTTLTPTLREQIIKISVDSFLDAYRDLTEEMLGLKPGLTKKQWLTDMAVSELAEFENGKHSLAILSHDDQPVGFILCGKPTARHADLKVDLYIDLLAVKPVRYHDEKVQLGFGRKLLENAMNRFEAANCLTLDTRVLNTPAQAFYKKLGFDCKGKFTFNKDYNPERYTGFEKAVMRRV